MKANLQRRLDLLSKARNYSIKMQKGSVFVIDFTVVKLLNEMIDEMQNMLAENLKYETFRKKRKE